MIIRSVVIQRFFYFICFMLSIIITAGGIGKRMLSETPKQFLLLNGRPILMHTIERLNQMEPTAELIVTLPEEHLQTWKGLCQTHCFDISHQLIVGGKERFDSVQGALKNVTSEFVAIHDGVRPFVSSAVFHTLIQTVVEKKAVIPVVPINESLRQQINGKTKAVLRKDYYIVQTPQLFETALIQQAYQQIYHSSFTDDATVLEALGHEINCVDGNEENIKITRPFDLLIAERLSEKYY